MSRKHGHNQAGNFFGLFNKNLRGFFCVTMVQQEKAILFFLFIAEFCCKYFLVGSITKCHFLLDNISLSARIFIGNLGYRRQIYQEKLSMDWKNHKNMDLLDNYGKVNGINAMEKIGHTQNWIF